MGGFPGGHLLAENRIQRRLGRDAELATGTSGLSILREDASGSGGFSSKIPNFLVSPWQPKFWSPRNHPWAVWGTLVKAESPGSLLFSAYPQQNPQPGSPDARPAGTGQILATSSSTNTCASVAE